MSLYTLSKKKISKATEFEKELKDIHGAIKILNDKQFRLSRDFDIFCWEFRIFDSNMFQNFLPNRVTFFLHCFLDASTLINLWRLPYLCYKHQPGIFLAVYLLMLLVVSTPVYFLEYSLGQCSSFGAPKCWEYAPAFHGIGMAMLLMSICVIYYYGGVLSYIYYMLYESFNHPLPWHYCQIGETNIKRLCESNLPRFNKYDCARSYYTEKGLCRRSSDKRIVGMFDQNDARKHQIYVNSSTSQFVKDFLLKFESDEPFLKQTPNMSITLFLLMIWIMVFLSLNFKIRKILPGKSISSILAIMPYVVLLVLLYYSFQSGYQNGYSMMATVDMKYILKGALWRDAATQALLVMSLGLGRTINLGSLNRFNQNVVQESIYGFIFVSVVSVLVVQISMDYIGVIATKLGSPPEKVIDQPILLMILVFGQAAKLFSFPPCFSIVTFGTFALVGTLGLISMSDNVVSNIADRHPSLYGQRGVIAAVFCMVMFFAEFIFTMPVGYLVMRIFDTTVVSWGYLFIVIMECVSIGFVYKTDKFLIDVQSVVGSNSFREKPWRYFRFYAWWCLMIITPGTLSFCILLDVIKYFIDEPEAELGLGMIPFSIHVIGLIISFILCLFPGLTNIGVQQGNLFKRIRSIYMPSKTWKAVLPSYRALCSVKDGQVVDSFTLAPIDKKEVEKRYNVIGPINYSENELILEEETAA